MKLTNYLHLVPSFKLCGVTPPVPQHLFAACCLIEHKDHWISCLVNFKSRFVLIGLKSNEIRPTFTFWAEHKQFSKVRQRAILSWHILLSIHWVLIFEYAHQHSLSSCTSWRRVTFVTFKSLFFAKQMIKIQRQLLITFMINVFQLKHISKMHDDCRKTTV